MNPCLFLESHGDHDYTSQIAPDNIQIGKKLEKLYVSPCI